MSATMSAGACSLCVAATRRVLSTLVVRSKDGSGAVWDIVLTYAGKDEILEFKFRND